MRSLYDSLNLPDPDKPETLSPQADEVSLDISVKAFCRGILTSPEYRWNLKDRILAGELPPALEVRLWDYAYGKPVEHVEVKGSLNLHDRWDDEELKERMRAILDTMGTERQPSSVGDESDAKTTLH